MIFSPRHLMGTIRSLMIFSIVGVICLVVSATLALGHSGGKVTPKKAASPITIDGKIEESIWKAALTESSPPQDIAMDPRAHGAGGIRSLKAVEAVATPIREACVSAVVSLMVTTISWPVGQRYGMINISISLLMLLIIAYTLIRTVTTSVTGILMESSCYLTPRMMP